MASGGFYYMFDLNNGSLSASYLKVNYLDGSSASKAGVSAAAIKASTGTNTNGVYWINLPTVGPTQVYCIMDSAVDGGGWMMAMKATRGTTFSYSSTHWTSVSTLNPTDTTRNDGDAKFDTMNYFPATDIMGLWPDITSVGGNLTLTNYGCWCWKQNKFNVNYATTSTSYPNASFTLTNGDFVNTAGVTPITLINFFNTVSRYFIGDAKTWKGWNNGTANSPIVFSSQTDVRFYGFNYYNNSSQRTRWGFGWNENGGGLFPGGNMDSDDVYGGIGMADSSYSAGERVACCADNTGINRSARVEIYIR